MAGMAGFEPTKCQSQSLVPYRLATSQYRCAVWWTHGVLYHGQFGFAILFCRIPSIFQKESARFSPGALCWHYLSSRQVTLQVLWARVSLTSVFGMGTGGPSPQSIPTLVGGFLPPICQSALRSNSLLILAPFSVLVNSFFDSLPNQSPAQPV